MKLSIIIPAYNEEKYIGTCLECILKCGNNLIHEIIVVDNGSTDRTAEVVRKFEGVKLISESKKSPTYARQKGYKEATGDLLAFIDADNHTNSSRAHKVHKAFASDPDLVFLSGPYVYYGNGSWRANPISRLCIRLFSYPGYLMTGCLGTGGNMIMKKTLLDTIGGFDTTIAFYGDDTNIARRAKDVGHSHFMLSLTMPTSTRRYKGQGWLKTFYLYTINFLSEAVFHKTHTNAYKDFR